MASINIQNVASVVELLVLLTVAYLWFLAVVSLLASGKERGEALQSAGETRFLVVIPAHNESPVIEKALRSLQGLNYPAERCDAVVIADNCDDDTAAIVSKSGTATCLVRNDSEKKGKGFALQ